MPQGVWAQPSKRQVLHKKHSWRQVVPSYIREKHGSILEYIPIKSMKFSGDALQKYLLTKSRDSSIAKLSIDYSKWCQYQRGGGGLVNPIAYQVDKIFGVSPLYLSAHLEPLYTWFIFQNAAHPPQQAPSGEPVPEPRAAAGLATFGEGMLQRLWTLVSSCGVLAHIEPSGLRVEMIGSGDNQIIMCKTDTKIQPHHIQTALFAALKSFETEACLKVKLFETFISSSYMEYGKACYIDGKKVTFGIKRATRIGTESQENIPTLNTKISGIYSTGVASASNSLTPAASYITTCVEVLYTLRERMGLDSSLPVERMITLLLLNRQAGGLKMSLYPCEVWMIVYRCAYPYGKLWRTEERTWLCYDRWELSLVPLGNWIGLKWLRTPSLFQSPDLATRIMESRPLWLVPCKLRQKTDIVKNLLKGTFGDHQEEAIVHTLSSMDPMCLKLASSIYEKCNEAIAEKLITMFQTSSSILRLIDNYVPFESFVTTARNNDSAVGHLAESPSELQPGSSRNRATLHEQNNQLPHCCLYQYKRKPHWQGSCEP